MKRATHALSLARRRQIFFAVLFSIGIESFASGLLLDLLRDTFVALTVNGPILFASPYDIGEVASKLPAPDFPRKYPFFSLVIAAPALLMIIGAFTRGGRLRFPRKETILHILLFFQVWAISMICLGFVVFLGPFRPILQVLPSLGGDSSWTAVSLIWVIIGLIAIIVILVWRSSLAAVKEADRALLRDQT